MQWQEWAGRRRPGGGRNIPKVLPRQHQAAEERRGKSHHGKEGHGGNHFERQGTLLVGNRQASLQKFLESLVCAGVIALE